MLKMKKEILENAAITSSNDSNEININDTNSTKSNTVNDRISPRGLILKNRFYPWGLNREGVLFETVSLLN